MAVLDWQEIRRAAEIIRAGGLVAIPTETVYGLAADATNDKAVARIFEVKARPHFNPLIVHVADLAMARRYTEVPPLAERLAAEFWPGPLTLVMKRRDVCEISLLASAGLDTLAVRAPRHPLAQAVIAAAGVPLAAPSANPSGAVSPTRAEHVRDGLGDRIDMILDGGPCPVGLESTIVKVEGDRAIMLRPGGVSAEAIERVIGRPLGRIGKSVGVEAPGMMASHYAPDAAMRLNVEAPDAKEVFLAFGPAPASHPYVLQLSERGELVEAAANLFAHLHAADALCRERALKGIAVAVIPATGLGEAINDRLRRAAAPR